MRTSYIIICIIIQAIPTDIIQNHALTIIRLLALEHAQIHMRDEKERRKKQAGSNKQQVHVVPSISIILHSI